MPARKYSEEQRLKFMALIDRGGSVRAAALSVGVHPDRGYRWMRQAGLSTPRSTQRRYTPEEKAEFFRHLAIGGNVSAVARGLGLNRVTCYAWAHKAGIFTGEYADAKRQAFVKLRREGLSRRVAAARLGVEAHQALDWDKGVRVFARGRVHPDGRVVLYRPEEVLANVRNPRTAWVQGDRVPLSQVEKVIHARYLSLVERERLKDLTMAGLSIRQVAAEMGRSPSTISRELRRNTVSKSGYLPHTAHRISVKRWRRSRTAKLAVEGPLREYVSSKLKKRWSPGTDQPPPAPRLPQRPGHAREPRDDLPSHLRARQRRAASRAGRLAAPRSGPPQTPPRPALTHPPVRRRDDPVGAAPR